MDYGWMIKEGPLTYTSGQLPDLQTDVGQDNLDASLSMPDTAGPYIRLGIKGILEGQLDRAELAFRQACRLDPTCSRAYAGLAVIYQQKGLLKAAFELYLKSLQRDSDNLTALLGLFQTSCQMGSFAKIIYYLELYMQSHPDDRSVMFCLAALYIKDGCIDKARKVLNTLLLLDPSNNDAAKLLEEIDNCLARGHVAP